MTIKFRFSDSGRYTCVSCGNAFSSPKWTDTWVDPVCDGCLAAAPPATTDMVEVTLRVSRGTLHTIQYFVDTGYDFGVVNCSDELYGAEEYMEEYREAYACWNAALVESGIYSAEVRRA